MSKKILAVRIHAGFNAGVFLGGLLALTEQTGGLASAYLRTLFPELDADVAFEHAVVNGISGWRAGVVVPPEHAHRHPADIFAIYGKSRLSTAAQEKARAVWMMLARAEAKVHNVPLEVVHFHEVGRMSNILAIGLCAEYLTTLGDITIAASAVPMGDGHVHCAHGEVPYPAPATFAMLDDVPVRPFFGTGEAITPTGLAILKGFGAHFGVWPEMTVRKTATVFVKQYFEGVPNGTLFAMGEPIEQPQEGKTAMAAAHS